MKNSPSDWMQKIQILLEQYQKGEYLLAYQRAKLLEQQVPENFKAVLYVCLSNLSLALNNLIQAQEYAQKAKASLNDESMFIQESQLITAENLPLLFQGKVNLCYQNLSQSEYKNYSVLLAIAECSYWLGEFQRAKTEFQNAYSVCSTKEDPSFARLGIARCCVSLKELLEAEKILLQLYQHQTTSSENLKDVNILAACELALVYACQNKISEARLLFDYDLQPEKFSKPQLLLSIYTSRAITHFMAKSFDVAIADLEKIISLPLRELEKIEAYLALGDIYTIQENLTLAGYYYQKACQFSEIFFAKEAKLKLEKILASGIVISSEDKMLETKPETNPTIFQNKVENKINHSNTISEIEQEIRSKVYTEIPKVKVTNHSNITAKTNLTVTEENTGSDDIEIWEMLPISAILLGLEMVEDQISKTQK